jgi:phage-related minor tail protein
VNTRQNLLTGAAAQPTFLRSVQGAAMTEFTIEAYEEIGDPVIARMVKDWESRLDGIEKEIQRVSDMCEKITDASKKVVKACTTRLKDKGLEKAEKKALNDLIDHAVSVRKRAARLDAL